MYVQNERVFHGVSYRFWAKMWHPEDPPPTSFRSPKKHVGGGYISGGQVKYFSEISCLTPPPKNSRVKGGDIYYILYIIYYILNILYYILYIILYIYMIPSFISGIVMYYTIKCYKYPHKYAMNMGGS